MPMLHGYNNAFWFASIIAAGALILSFFLKSEHAAENETNPQPVKKEIRKLGEEK